MQKKLVIAVFHCMNPHFFESQFFFIWHACSQSLRECLWKISDKCCDYLRSNIRKSAQKPIFTVFYCINLQSIYSQIFFLLHGHSRSLGVCTCKISSSSCNYFRKNIKFHLSTSLRPDLRQNQARVKFLFCIEFKKFKKPKT